MLFKHSEELTKEEWEIIELLLSGHSKALDGLRNQLHSKLFLGIRRRSPTTKPIVYRTTSNQYVIDITYDEVIAHKYTIGNSASLRINDLTIIDTRMAEEIRVGGVVRRGILVNIEFITKNPTKWPKTLRLDDWYFSYGDGEKHKTRPRKQMLEVETVKANKELMAESWVKEILFQVPLSEEQIGVRNPATEQEIEQLETKLSERLPSDFKEFLAATNGVVLGQMVVLGCEEIYELDIDNRASGMIVFYSDDQGDLTVLDLNEIAIDGKSCPIKYFQHDPQQVTIVADSFREWFSKSIEEATNS